MLNFNVQTSKIWCVNSKFSIPIPALWGPYAIKKTRAKFYLNPNQKKDKCSKRIVEVTSSKFRPVILRYNSKLQTISWRCNFMVTDGYNHVMWCPFCIDFNIIFGPRRSIELPGSIVRINWKPSGKIRSCMWSVMSNEMNGAQVWSKMWNFENYVISKARVDRCVRAITHLASWTCSLM